MRNWRRCLAAVGLALAAMFLDTLALARVRAWYRPGQPPAWLVNFLYYLLAWPLFVTRYVFPRAEGDADEGPSVLAVASAGLIDLVLLTLLFYALLSRRARRRKGPSDDG